jgi:hypothetical protein
MLDRAFAATITETSGAAMKSRTRRLRRHMRKTISNFSHHLFPVEADAALKAQAKHFIPRCARLMQFHRPTCWPAKHSYVSLGSDT